MTPPTTATTAAPAAVTPMNPSVGSAPSLPQGGQYASEPPREHYGIEPDPPPLMLEPDPDPAAPAPPGPPPAPARRDHRPLPAAAVNPEQIPNLSVAQYAAFCAACANAPERLAITMSEYGVANERVKAALDALWQDRFDDEPEQLQQWEHLFAQFRGQLKR